MSVTWVECCVASNFFRLKYLPLLWTLSVITLQIVFMLKQQHYTLT